MPIINSLLDNDLYKFTMQYAVFQEFPNVEVKYKFKCRTSDIIWTREHIDKIKNEIHLLCTLSLSRKDIKYLSSLNLFSGLYLHYLYNFKLNENLVTIQGEEKLLNEDAYCRLNITIQGSWLQTILFEVPILAIVSEVYYREKHFVGNGGIKRLDEKINRIEDFRENNPDFSFIDFGTRRRLSYEWHNHVLQTLVRHNLGIAGTSNVYFAMKYDLPCIGTMAHEWIQAGQGLIVLKKSQKFMLRKWLDVYGKKLGIALTDTLGIDTFLKDFDSNFVGLYSGVRQDSGNPFEVAEKIIKHYKDLGIDPKTKTIIFSDGLHFQTAFVLYKTFKDEINVNFGIGTHLTNDSEINPLQLVIKMVECDGYPVAKISDSPGKGMCESENYLNYLKELFGI